MMAASKANVYPSLRFLLLGLDKEEGVPVPLLARLSMLSVAYGKKKEK